LHTPEPCVGDNFFDVDDDGINDLQIQQRQVVLEFTGVLEGVAESLGIKIPLKDIKHQLEVTQPA
jgi:hypothetical protein